MCARTYCSDPTQPHFGLNFRPNEGEVEKFQKLIYCSKTFDVSVHRLLRSQTNKNLNSDTLEDR